MLDELRVLWETKLQQSGVLESDISAPQYVFFPCLWIHVHRVDQVGRVMCFFPLALLSFVLCLYADLLLQILTTFLLRMRFLRRSATGAYDASQSFPLPSFLSNFQGMQSQPLSFPHQHVPALSGLPPQHISQFQAPKREQQLYHGQGVAPSSVQQPPVIGSYTLAATDLVGAPGRHINTPADPNFTNASYGGSSLAPAGTLGAVADSRKRKADDPLDAYGGHQGLQQPLPTHTSQFPQNGSIPQQVGAASVTPTVYTHHFCI